MRALALVLGLAGCPEPSTDRMVALALDDGTPFRIDKYEYPNREGQYPQRGVTFAEAERLCAEAGKRLCTAAEWRRACAGPGGANRYGYADHLVPNICRVEIDLPAGHTSLTNAGEDPVDRPQEGGVTASGSYWDCRTPEGVHDLVGNLEEWVLDDPAVGGAGLEGGAWYTRKAWADCTGRYSRAPDYRLDPTQPVASAGFRCCAGATHRRRRRRRTPGPGSRRRRGRRRRPTTPRTTRSRSAGTASWTGTSTRTARACTRSWA